MKPPLALDGIHVLALEASVSGPFCTRILGDMGAEIIKIERPGVGDLIRGWDSTVKGLSSGYVWLTGNKKSLTVDLKKEEGREIIHRLVARSDVLVENFAPGVAGRLGFGSEAMRKLNPRLIYCSISGYGQDGPFRDVKAYDLLIQGEAGIIASTGYPDRPAKVSIPISDLAAAAYAALGIVLALYQREKTGRGQVIDISMLESVVSWLGYFPQHYWHRGEEPQRVGMRHHYVTPYGPYLAQDGVYINMAVATPQDWQVFCSRVIEKPELLQDPRFATNENRRKNRAILEELIEKIFLEKPHDEWLKRLKAAELPYGEVRGIGQVLAHPQLIARKMFLESESPVGTIPTVSSPLHLSDSPVRNERIPALGQDTKTILKELGYADDQIFELGRAGVI